ncbi:DUF1491 family protein [Terricaulis sp.]|uniref:DUF1491 family protein n=1 Tax=Terricaulis sp. TaxID=2768686 RepID=UPI002AC76C11|nr:DUF1491 family protein [Terricaulis sp.]MDZ4690852.1 DUF1491 family protein [Terricaulis sp.]
MEELKTDFWASALIRRAQIGGAFAGVVRKGDTDAGAVLVKVATMNRKARLYAPARNGEGDRVWLDLSAGTLGDDEAEVDAAIRKRMEKDPDLWVIEVEDKWGRHFLDEPVDSGGA